MPAHFLSAAVFAMVLSGASVAADGGGCRAAVVYRSGSEVYEAAVAGIRDALASAACRIDYMDIAAAQGPPQTAKLFPAPPTHVVAVGIGAWEWLAASGGDFNVIASLLLRSDRPAAKKLKPAGAVYADVPIARIAESLHDIFPGQNRVALIRRAGLPPLDAASLARVRQLGIDLRVVESAGGRVLNDFAALKGKVDFAIAEPDAELFNSATVKPLVLSSIELRVPIMGFSAGFVRAGALAGVYPDYRELGRQTGEMLLRMLAGKGGRAEDESPRKLEIAINDKVVRLLGLEPATRKGLTVLK